ncbi:hypothetical protein [Lacticaseibacillus camelliae]|uniref:hypothetical protein n=1 Tax=Lacticaseibacillus camelliae TaxID=381742 RepID=UPI00138ED990|nr:hypothetical protein [Lacticaseibacillus camelliae]
MARTSDQARTSGVWDQYRPSLDELVGGPAWGIGCGLILSLMLVLLGATLPQPVMLMSGLLEVLALLLSGLGFAPWFLALAGLIVVLPAWFGPVPAPARWLAVMWPWSRWCGWPMRCCCAF